MKSFSKQFNGEKEEYTERYSLLKVDLLQKGLSPVGLSRAGDCQKKIFLATFVVAKLPKVVIGSDFKI
jgi:hypothetical protein